MAESHWPCLVRKGRESLSKVYRKSIESLCEVFLGGYMPPMGGSYVPPPNGSYVPPPTNYVAPDLATQGGSYVPPPNLQGRHYEPPPTLQGGVSVAPATVMQPQARHASCIKAFSIYFHAVSMLLCDRLPLIPPLLATPCLRATPPRLVLLPLPPLMGSWVNFYPELDLGQVLFCT